MAVTVNKPATTAAAEPTHKVLCLAIYERLMRQGQLYEKTVPYKFTAEQADILLAEVEEDTDRPIWKVYKQAKVNLEALARAAEGQEPVDMTRTSVEEAPEGDAPAKSNRIDIGDDAELAELLGNDAAEAGVQV